MERGRHPQTPFELTKPIFEFLCRFARIYDIDIALYKNKEDSIIGFKQFGF